MFGEVIVHKSVDDFNYKVGASIRDDFQRQLNWEKHPFVKESCGNIFCIGTHCFCPCPLSCIITCNYDELIMSVMRHKSDGSYKV